MKKVYNIARSFRYAFAGLLYALKTQRNMRIHFSAAVLVIAFGCFYGLAAVEWVALGFTVTFVIVCEMFNTAVENAVDVATDTYHDKAKIAKDVAAGAVLMSALLALAVAVLLFCDAARLGAALTLIFSNGWYIGGFITAIILAVCWVMSGGKS